MKRPASRRTSPSNLGWRWFLANFVAVVLAVLAVLPLAVNLAYAHQPAWLRGLVAGAALGLAQWLWLRQRIPNAAWWLVANAGGWAAALGLAALWPGGGASGWLLIGGTVNRVITGWLVQRWLPESNDGQKISLS